MERKLVLVGLAVVLVTAAGPPVAGVAESAGRSEGVFQLAKWRVYANGGPCLPGRQPGRAGPS